MVVCICNRVTDSSIRDCVARGACSLKDVREALGVGMACGACARYARALVKTYAAEAMKSDSPEALNGQPRPLRKALVSRRCRGRP